MYLIKKVLLLLLSVFFFREEFSCDERILEKGTKKREIFSSRKKPKERKEFYPIGRRLAEEEKRNNAHGPLTLSKTIGLPPTDLNALTGEFTPPGNKSCASLKILCELSVLKAALVMVTIFFCWWQLFLDRTEEEIFFVWVPNCVETLLVETANMFFVFF